MTQRRKPIPKSQVELSQETIEPYLNQGKAPVPSGKRRENQRSVKNDEVKQLNVGLTDLDGAIVYYFNNVIRPSVIQNGVKTNVPFIYGSPERWAAVQKDGAYRDRSGKIQTPLIMFKRDSIEKNRALGNKMDANTPNHFGIFEKKYSKKNVYDRFSQLVDRKPVREFYGVIMPDYVNVVYSCTVFTEYVEQMNKIVESINFASDSYWGDPERFKFRAAIDNYTTVTELVQGADRVVKTTFQIKLAGYIVPDSINTSVANPNKFYSKSSIKFQTEVAGDLSTLNRKATTPERTVTPRFYDAVPVCNIEGGMTTAQILFLGLNSTALATAISGTIAEVTGATIATPPAGFTVTQNSFQVYVNGVYVSTNLRNVTQVGSDIQIEFIGLEFPVEVTDQIILAGKFN